MLPRADLRAFDPGDPRDREALERAAAWVLGGGLMAYPTETVYGFGGAAEPEPVRRLLALKGRGPDRPALVLVDGPGMVPELAWSAEARELAEVFWPGALTLVLRDPGGRFPPGVRSAEGGVAVRRCGHPLADALVRAVGAPVTSTSANAPGEAPALTADEAERAATAQGALARDMLVVDGGRLPPSPPSTLVDCTGDAPRVLRQGAVPLARLRCVLPEVAGDG